MITDNHELQEALEELRRRTLPPVWEEFGFALQEPAISSGEYLEQLDELLTTIYRSRDTKLKREALQTIKEYIDIEVDCEPTVEVYWR
jgi:hypothetical protein